MHIIMNLGHPKARASCQTEAPSPPSQPGHRTVPDPRDGTPHLTRSPHLPQPMTRSGTALLASLWLGYPKCVANQSGCSELLQVLTGAMHGTPTRLANSAIRTRSSHAAGDRSRIGFIMPSSISNKAWRPKRNITRGRLHHPCITTAPARPGRLQSRQLATFDGA